MRKGIRKQLIDNIEELKEVYQPAVPSPKTAKPYAVALKKDDTGSTDPTNFARSIEIWLYTDIGSFKEMDKLETKVIAALNLIPFQDPETKKYFTASFEGIISQDLVDEEWGANIRGLSFKIIALHTKKDTVDHWAEGLAKFINNKLEIPAYSSLWETGFSVPSILCRTINQQTEEYNANYYYDYRTIRVHIVAQTREEKEDIAKAINYLVRKAIKIPINEDRREFMTIQGVNTNINAEMLGAGQVTINTFRVQNIERDIEPIITKVKGRYADKLD